MTVKVKDHPNERLVPFPPHAELVARAKHAAALADDPLAAWITAQLLLDAVGCAIGGLEHPLSPALAAMLGPELGRTPRGSRTRARIDKASGGVDRPWAAEQVVAKFERLTGNRWPPSARPGWVEAALGLQTLPDAGAWIAGRPPLGA